MAACSSAADAPPPFTEEADIESGPEVDETSDELARPFWFATEDTAVCPSGATFDDARGLCVRGDEALGPFTRTMVAACHEASESGCDEDAWPLALAARLRGDETCPAGSAIDPDLGVCTEGDFAYGPFDAPMTEECQARGGTACDSMRWERAWIAPLPEDEAASDGDLSTQAVNQCSGLNARMAAYYGSRSGYNKVSRAGLKYLGTRKNGCATWLSYAIKQSGGTMNVQANTEAFRDELLRRGWKVIRNKADLQPGDVIITKDRRGWKGHPDHVYMFAGWSDRAQTSPLAVDNQGFTHARGRGKSPIAFGLRAPDATGAGCTTTADGGDAGPAQPDNCQGKKDGWYCSELRDFSAYRCKSTQIAEGWQCSDGTVCRPDGAGKATLSGQKPGCFGKR